MTQDAEAATPDTAAQFRMAAAADGAAISRIHAEGLASGHASFREAPYPAETAWQATDGGIVRVGVGVAGLFGWASVTPSSDRCTYAGVGEVSLYVARSARGRGLGGALLADLAAASEAAGFWTLTAQIFPENEASLSLFARSGFRVVGVRRRLGRMTYGPLAGEWRDVVAMERRSETVGVTD
ncbi:MAG: GNAT family N-acetyltransferase [Pseudomonadota bacterium]